MPLINELKELRDEAKAALEHEQLRVMEHQDSVDEWNERLSDLDLAIAALQPGEVMITVTNDEPDLAAPIVNTDEGWELEPETQAGVEIPEGFTKWEGGECPLPVGTRFDMICRACGPWHDMEVLADSSLEWQHTGRDLDVIAYRIIEASPTSEDQPDDASEFAEPDDEAERAAAIELTADVEPEPEFIELDQETCEPIQPQWNEPQTEGYAPVVDNAEAHIQAVEAERYALATNPEADALAKAHDYYSPEKVAERNRFNPWGGVAHLFGKSKVDA